MPYATKEARDEFGANWRNALRAKVFAHYGTTCACCGATGKLYIDHINGDGLQHRAAMQMRAGCATYLWIIRNGYPGGFQSLCPSCSTSKRDGPRCMLHGPDGYIAQIGQMAADGMRQRDIGDAIGLTQTAVSYIMRAHLGITRGRGRPDVAKGAHGWFTS